MKPVHFEAPARPARFLVSGNDAGARRRQGFEVGGCVTVVTRCVCGCSPGHQACNQGATLGAIVDHLTSPGPEQRIGLALNGNVVDFLAAKDATRTSTTRPKR